MAEKHIYYVHGYDKDADVYETVAVTPLYDYALTVGKALMHYHKSHTEICRADTEEPFDWFTVSNEDGKPVKVFTAEYPDGIHPEELG